MENEFIVLTDAYNPTNRIFIRYSSIVLIAEVDKLDKAVKTTNIIYGPGDDEYAVVKETPEEVFKKIHDVKFQTKVEEHVNE